jgi:hypothetical protein
MKDDHRIENIREIIWNNKRVRAFDSYDKNNVFEGTFTASLRTPKNALWKAVEALMGETYEHS